MGVKLPDISEYYTEGRAYDEEVQWILTRQYQNNLGFLLPGIEEHGIRHVVEFGCGTGLVAQGLIGKVDTYVGVDKNPTFLKIASQRCRNTKGFAFILSDVRKDLDLHADLVTCWAFLKHFSLEEWDKVFRKVLSAGKYAAFNVQILGSDLDDGTEYHHTFVTEARLQACLVEAGHEEISRTVFWEGELRDKGIMREVSIWTKHSALSGELPQGQDTNGGQ